MVFISASTPVSRCKYMQVLQRRSVGNNDAYGWARIFASVALSASKSVYSLVFPSALAFAHLALAAADSLALTAGLLRQSFLAGLDLAFPFAFALAHRIFRARARAFMSLRRWAADM
jgi:hypothetical protein